ncbi:MAG: formate/nitrite transporter family protein [Gammaproteobacteria bacterium]
MNAYAPNPTASATDAYAPAQIAQLIEAGGVRKAQLSILQLLILGMLAGAFIAFGAMLSTLVLTGSTLGFGPSRLLAGAAFSLGLVLVLVGGAELFTGNNLIVMAWADGKVSTAALLRNWAIVYIANCAGALGSVALLYWSGTLHLGGGAVAETAAAIAAAKLKLGLVEALTRGVLGNTLVCLAVWLSFACHDVASKILAIAFPVTAFVALGFEHSIANMYLLPIGMLASGGGIDIPGLVANLASVTLGNLIGGGGLVALVYWLVYLRPAR